LSNAPIFISYRRKDTAAYARGVYERLAQRFGPERVFLDVSILPGLDFVEVIQEAVRSSGAVVVVIGPDWLSKREESLPESSEDYVVFEVATALEHRRLVIPVLVEGASMPTREELPDPMKPLATIEALEISDERWDYDLNRLCDRLEEVLPRDGAAPAKPEGTRANEVDVARSRLPFSTRSVVVVSAVVVALLAAGVVATLYRGGGPSDGRLGDRVLTSKMQGDDVRQLQVLLQRLGFNAGLPDGEFSDQTARAVVAFKTCWGEGLQPDTRVDEKTVNALRTHGIVTGTNGNDIDLRGTNRSDIIFGLNGNDTIAGLDGDDKLCGGEGEDTLIGGGGVDRLYGGADNDHLLGEGDDDTLIGFKGADRVDGGAGVDACALDSGDTPLRCER
jgi:hypothetical protein